MSAERSGIPVAPDNAALTAMVLELASQLHVERARRIALELALARAGVVPPDAIAALAIDPEFRRSSQAALDAAMARIMRVITGDEKR